MIRPKFQGLRSCAFSSLVSMAISFRGVAPTKVSPHKPVVNGTIVGLRQFQTLGSRRETDIAIFGLRDRDGGFCLSNGARFGTAAFETRLLESGQSASTLAGKCRPTPRPRVTLARSIKGSWGVGWRSDGRRTAIFLILATRLFRGLPLRPHVWPNRFLDMLTLRPRWASCCQTAQHCRQKSQRAARHHFYEIQY